MSGWHKTSRHERGYGSKWVKLRAVILKRDNHLCQPCLRNGRPTQATAVDHIKPKAKGGTDEPENLEATCDQCHAVKTQAEAGGKPRLRFDANGFPVW
jgi:5-methylcytosine-specific restriction protein A